MRADGPERPHSELGARLRAWRERLGLTQERLAERAGVSVRTIRYLERGEFRPSPETARLLGGALELDGPVYAQLNAAAFAGREAAAPVPAAAAPRPPGAVAPAQLPADVAGFTGREQHLRGLDALLAADGPERTVVISAIGGTAGVGKTALALHWAHRVADRFPDGQLFVDLHGWAPGPPVAPLRALAQLLGALGVEPDRVPLELDRAAGLYRSLLAGRRVLLVVDNARDAAQVRPLLPGAPGCLVVVTSRDRLAGLVASHGAHRFTLDVLAPDEAVGLLARLIGQERVRAEPEAAAELVDLCCCLPLAVRIAAANLACRPDQSVGGHLRRLRGGDRLAELAVDGDRQAAVAAAFDCSYATLDPGARRLFRLLGLVPGADFTAGAAAALAGTPVELAGRLLERLAGAHLLEPRGAGRFALHDLLRLYARQRAERDDDEPERRRALGRLLDWYLHGAGTAAGLLYPQILRLPAPETAAGLPPLGFGDHAGALAWLDAERANLVAAVQHAAEQGPRPPAWLLADGLRGYFLFRRSAIDWQAAAAAGLTAALQEGAVQAEAAMRLSHGSFHQSLGRYGPAIEHFTTALALAREAGWSEGQAVALGNLGTLYQDTGRLEQGADHHLQALALDRRLGQQASQAACLGNLGITYKMMGRLRQAADQQVEALALYRRGGSRLGEANTLGNLADVGLELGQPPDRVAGHVLRALTLHQQEGDRYGEAFARDLLAVVHREAGRHAQALEEAQTALALAREIGERRAEAESLNILGSIHLRLDRHRQAADEYRRALELARATGLQYPETEALLGLAAARLALGDRGRALEHARQGRALARRQGFRLLEGRALSAQAAACLAAGDRDRAVGHARQALALFVELGAPDAERVRPLLDADAGGRA